MKKHVILIILLIMLVNIQATVVTQKHTDTERVKNQHEADIEKKEALKKRMYELMDEINSHVDGKAKLIIPVEPDKATDVIDHDEYAKKEKAPEKKHTPAKKKDEAFIAPAQGKMTSKYGYRENPVTKKYSFHKGIDIAAPKGSKVVASASGTIVTSVYMNNGYGNCIIIEHANDIKTLYAHLEKRIVKAGDIVSQGQQIGTVGATGRATGPHLHYEVYKGKNSINPQELVHY
ncbi:MAG: M23 family metallopeptidase [Spirochaetes bacterium]|nr:M23 family metallopeptidase [Spirochaetota bacterium]